MNIVKPYMVVTVPKTALPICGLVFFGQIDLDLRHQRSSAALAQQEPSPLLMHHTPSLQQWSAELALPTISGVFESVESKSGLGCSLFPVTFQVRGRLEEGIESIGISASRFIGDSRVNRVSQVDYDALSCQSLLAFGVTGSREMLDTGDDHA